MTKKYYIKKEAERKWVIYSRENGGDIKIDYFERRDDARIALTEYNNVWSEMHQKYYDKESRW